MLFSKEDTQTNLFDTLLLEKAKGYLDATGQELLTANNFRIISDIEESDNTVGGRIFSESTPVSGCIGKYRLPLSSFVEK